MEVPEDLLLLSVWHICSKCVNHHHYHQIIQLFLTSRQCTLFPEKEKGQEHVSSFRWERGGKAVVENWPLRSLLFPGSHAWAHNLWNTLLSLQVLESCDWSLRSACLVKPFLPCCLPWAQSSSVPTDLTYVSDSVCHVVWNYLFTNLFSTMY